MIKVSVIIAAFNEEKYVGRCLRSIFGQTMSTNEYEIIVVNDGSSDKTSYALDLFKKPKDDNYKVITNKKNIGLPASINLGIDSARGEYIVRVDSDDYVNKNFLSVLSYYLDCYIDAKAVSCDYILVDKNENTLEIIKSKNYPIACGIMFRKKNLKEIGQYDESFKCHEDRELRIRFEKFFKIHNINLPLYRYRKHEKNMTNDKKLLDAYEELLIEKHGKNIL
tara:strand:+ start:2278 stop:2946 length:669 start_codon:yes stop_codon:yes gene_type:complete